MKNKQDNKEIIVEELTKSIFKDEAKATMVRREELPSIADNILSKLQKLDRGNIKEIYMKYADPKIARINLDEMLDQICQLIPEGVVIVGGEVIIEEDLVDKLLEKVDGKKGKLIFIEDKVIK